MTSRLGALLARQMSLSTLNKSLTAILRATTVPARKRACVQLIRPMATSSTGYEGDGSRRVIFYTDYTVYKGRGAMTVKVIKPLWERTSTGNGLKIARVGTLLLEFANSKGEREYDWEKKETFALSAVECAEILEMDQGTEKSFFHDPNKFGSGEGAITKSLRITPAKDTGFFFSLSVNNKIASSQMKYDTVVSTAELRVIRTIMDYAIPRILGFEEIFAGAPEVKEGTPSAPDSGSEPPF